VTGIRDIDIQERAQVSQGLKNPTPPESGLYCNIDTLCFYQAYSGICITPAHGKSRGR